MYCVQHWLPELFQKLIPRVIATYTEKRSTDVDVSASINKDSTIVPYEYNPDLILASRNGNKIYPIAVRHE